MKGPVPLSRNRPFVLRRHESRRSFSDHGVKVGHFTNWQLEPGQSVFVVQAMPWFASPPQRDAPEPHGQTSVVQLTVPSLLNGPAATSGSLWQYGQKPPAPEQSAFTVQAMPGVVPPVQVAPVVQSALLVQR